MQNVNMLEIRQRGEDWWYLSSIIHERHLIEKHNTLRSSWSRPTQRSGVLKSTYYFIVISSFR